MMKLITILESLKQKPRPVTDEENLYLDQLCSEMQQTDSEAARWRILQREGIDHIDIERYGFDTDLLEVLIGLRRASMN